MSLISINPADESVLAEHAATSPRAVERTLDDAVSVRPLWAGAPFAERVAVLLAAAKLLEERRDKLARLVSSEMGKLVGEARGEVEKCAWVCRYYAEHAEAFLADEVIATDARKSCVAFQPLGTVLAVMPWNFPLWQVFRCAAPALAAGNTLLLKHASNVSLCALAIEDLFADAGCPRGVFATLLVGSDRMGGIIADPRVNAVSVTGSVPAGRAVAAAAAERLKKTVLELGGSDAFVVLEDADVERAAETAVTARYMNAGQSCIAAKRFLVVEPVAERFIDAFAARVEALTPGDPLDEATTLAPMARSDLRDALDAQVRDSIAAGARPLAGCRTPDRAGAFYPASILGDVAPGMPAADDELFGPVAAIMRVPDETRALEIANATRFGLGGSVWTGDPDRGERFARRLECGAAFVNEMVKSDPRVPFGGIKDSGYGRELSQLGIREFVNAKTVWIA